MVCKKKTHSLPTAAVGYCTKFGTKIAGTVVLVLDIGRIRLGSSKINLCILKSQ